MQKMASKQGNSGLAGGTEAPVEERVDKEDNDMDKDKESSDSDDEVSTFLA